MDLYRPGCKARIVKLVVQVSHIKTVYDVGKLVNIGDVILQAIDTFKIPKKVPWLGDQTLSVRLD